MKRTFFTFVLAMMAIGQEEGEETGKRRGRDGGEQGKAP